MSVTAVLEVARWLAVAWLAASIIAIAWFARACRRARLTELDPDSPEWEWISEGLRAADQIEPARTLTDLHNRICGQQAHR